MFSLTKRKIKNSALEASNAPVSMDRIDPERVGNVFERWKDEMNMNGPPKDKKRYPGMYPSKPMLLESPKSIAPRERKPLPIIPHTRGPYVSRIVPIGRADTLVATAAMVNIRLRLSIL